MTPRGATDVTYEKYQRIVPGRIAARRALLGITLAEMVERVRRIANRGSWPSDDSWGSKVESGGITLGLDDGMILAEALETSVAYLCGEIPFSVQGWERISESDRQMGDRVMNGEEQRPTQDALDVEAAHRGDGPCADCGTLDNIVWFTDSVFWNAVIRSEPDYIEPTLCVWCFVQRAEAKGYRPTGWRLQPEFHWENVHDCESQVGDQ